jgi:hypothetical protein
VNVDASGEGGRGHADARGEDLGELAAAAGSEHDLGGVDRTGEVEQGSRDVGADDLVIAAAEAFHQDALPGQRSRIGPRQPVAAGDVHRHEVRALVPRGDPGRPPDQRRALRAAGERDDNPFPGLPGGVDVVVGAVLVELVLDLVGEPEQCQLAQRGEVAGPEVIAEGRVDLLRPVDVAVRHPAAQRLRRHVDELDLLGRPDYGVGHGLALLDAGDLRDDVVERLEMLNVDIAEHGDARIEQLLDVLPALGVARAGDVGVRELVDDRQLGLASQHRVDVHLGEFGAAVLDGLARHHFKVADHRLRVLAAVRLDERDDHVGAAIGAAVRLLQHRVCLADARGGAEVDPQFSACHLSPPPSFRYLSPSRARLSSSTLTPGSPMNPSARPCVYFLTKAFTVSGERPRSRAIRGTCSAA